MTTGFDRRTERGSDDPTTVHSVAVTVEDVLTALEASQRADRPAVLRVTPPFAGRMRARLHVAGGTEVSHEGTRPLHIDPAAFVDPDLPPVPTVDETEDELRRRGDYSVERHRTFHADRVEAWRERVRANLLDRVSLATTDGEHVVDVNYLGRRGEAE
jgi:hypothetical protein